MVFDRISVIDAGPAEIWPWLMPAGLRERVAPSGGPAG
jgi:hypothetical protein